MGVLVVICKIILELCINFTEYVQQLLENNSRITQGSDQVTRLRGGCLSCDLLSYSRVIHGLYIVSSTMTREQLKISNLETSYTVTLKILSSLSALRTDSPNEPALGLKWVQTTSNTDPEMTRQSNRLNEDSM